MEKCFPSVYEEFIYKRTYSRYIDKENRRENWDETVNRYADFFKKKLPNNEKVDLFAEVIDGIISFNNMPSMRSLWSAGTALERDNIAGYNCAYLTIDHHASFSELLYILMNGTGAGWSVERQYISKLPEVPELTPTEDIIVVADSKLGWAKGLKSLLNYLYDGDIPKYDLSKLRPKGAKLKTFGGRSSGPEPLKQLFDFIIHLFKQAQHRKLNSIECHDICCVIAQCVVVGGVRRSAGISLSNLSDTRMRHAKDGEFWKTAKHRSLSNNSVAYTEKPEMAIFMDEWISLMRNGNGERGIVNRESLKKMAKAIGRDADHEFGLNPCGEISLRPFEFCNLTEAIVRYGDTLEELKIKVRNSTILGILQSTLTDFNFLRNKWKDNCSEERLLGVSLTGTCDHEVLQRVSDEAERWLCELREHAWIVAKEWSDYLGISMPAAITCTKPSGTVSQLVNCSSGLHTRYADYYIRRVRVTKSDPVAMLLISAGVTCEPEVEETWENYNTLVFDFPVKSDGKSRTRDEMNALDQLEYWKMFKINWTDHNPSVTIYVEDHEWMEVGAWVYKNWDIIGGLSFLPKDGGSYPLAPYEEITKEKYEEMIASFPSIDFTKLSDFEKEDATFGAAEMACSGGSCELR